HVAACVIPRAQQVVAGQQGPVAAELAGQHELQQRGVERLIGVGVRHVFRDAVLGPYRTAPQRVGAVVQGQRQAGAVTGAAVDHLHVLGRTGQAQALGDVPVVADTRGGLYIAATDRIAQA
ncbi:hypothetical protein B8W90_11495, partial [Staphylococcus hominis]